MGWRVGDEDIDRVVEMMKLLSVEGFALRDFSELPAARSRGSS